MAFFFFTIVMAAIARGAIAEIWQRLHDVAGLERRWI